MAIYEDPAEKMRQLQLDNRVLKKYIEDLKSEISRQKEQAACKDKALRYAKQLLMGAGVRDHAFEKIRQLELNVSSVSEAVAKSYSQSN